MDAQKIKEALKKLDHNNPNHWTSEGLPRLETVRFYTKSSNITRENITAADPDFKRNPAMAKSNAESNPPSPPPPPPPPPPVEKSFPPLNEGSTPSPDKSKDEGKDEGNGEGDGESKDEPKSGSARPPAGDTAIAPQPTSRPLDPKAKEGDGDTLVEATLSPAPADVQSVKSMIHPEGMESGAPRAIPAPTMLPNRIAQTGTDYAGANMGGETGNAKGNYESTTDVREGDPEVMISNPMNPDNPLSADPEGQRNEMEYEKTYQEGPVGEAKREVDKAKDEVKAAQERVREAEKKVDEAKRSQSEESRKDREGNPIAGYLKSQQELREKRGQDAQALRESGVDQAALKKAMDPRDPIDQKAAGKK